MGSGVGDTPSDWHKTVTAASTTFPRVPFVDPMELGPWGLRSLRETTIFRTVASTRISSLETTRRPWEATWVSCTSLTLTFGDSPAAARVYKPFIPAPTGFRTGPVALMAVPGSRIP